MKFSEPGRKLLDRLCEYWQDKRLAEKCGLSVKDICVHEFRKKFVDPGDYFIVRCIKCGEYYE